MLKIFKRLIGTAEGNVSQSGPHPWFHGFDCDDAALSQLLLKGTLQYDTSQADLSAPVLFIARGHSGTMALAKVLEFAGVYMGSSEDAHCLNDTYDSLYWAYGFQRTLVPRMFEWGVGCKVDGRLAVPVGLECLRRHLGCFAGGRWGFKTCLAAFSHPLYSFIFPRAKYIYLIRDGRDVILSGNGILYLTNPSSRSAHWDYFKIITFGISNDIAAAPFPFPAFPEPDDDVMQNRFWIQAKSWREHVLMMEHLKASGQMSENIYTLRYEDLCREPAAALRALFEFLDIGFTDDVKDFAMQFFHTESIGRWKQYSNYIDNVQEDMNTVFESMKPELEKLGYE